MHMTIAAGLTSTLSRTRTEPRAQAQAVDAWIAASRAWPDLAGFVAGALLRSLDGERVVAYLQSTSSLTSLAAADPAATDSHTYQVVTLEAPPRVRPTPLSIVPGAGVITLINIFDTDPTRQQKLVDTWIAVGEPFTHHPGFVAAALHRSTDGTRVVNYAHWRGAADWQDLVAQQGHEFARFRPLGQSDPHLYEVVHVLQATPAASPSA
jgi:hypothetical protein